MIRDRLLMAKDNVALLFFKHRTRKIYDIDLERFVGRTNKYVRENMILSKKVGKDQKYLYAVKDVYIKTVFVRRIGWVEAMSIEKHKVGNN